MIVENGLASQSITLFLEKSHKINKYSLLPCVNTPET